MDNKKIGKLIADLRKKKGLTQQELGDKVGVGFRAVSKWERGITLPDITIINEVSKILGISSDELLSGKIKKENKDKKKLSPKLKITLFTIVTLIVIFASVLAYYNNKTYTYDIESASDEYYVEGQVIIHKNNIRITINNLSIKDKDILTTEIQNYEYQIFSGDKLVVGYGSTPETSSIDETNTIKKLEEEFRVNYNSRTTIKRKELLKNGLELSILFETEKSGIINKTIKIQLISTEKNK